jgi:hypothetical protein
MERVCLKDELRSLPGAKEVFKCEVFAKGCAALFADKVCGQFRVIEVRAPGRYLLFDEQQISSNHGHFMVEVLFDETKESVFFDNMSPEGISRLDWLKRSTWFVWGSPFLLWQERRADSLKGQKAQSDSDNDCEIPNDSDEDENNRAGDNVFSQFAVDDGDGAKQFLFAPLQPSRR